MVSWSSSSRCHDYSSPDFLLFPAATVIFKASLRQAGRQTFKKLIKPPLAKVMTMLLHSLIRHSPSVVVVVFPPLLSLQLLLWTGKSPRPRLIISGAYCFSRGPTRPSRQGTAFLREMCPGDSEREGRGLKLIACSLRMTPHAHAMSSGAGGRRRRPKMV